MALCTAVVSAEESRKYWHHHKAEDPNTFVVGERFYSGPQPGETLTGFTVLHLKRNHLQGEFDPVALAAGKPHFIIFIDDSDILSHNRKTEIGFTNMRERIWGFFNSAYQIGYAPDGRDGPGAYGLNRDFPMTIILADAEGKVIYNFPYRDIPPDFPSPHVLGGMAGAVGEDRETVAGWLNNIPGVWHEWYNEEKDMKNEDMKKKGMKNKAMKK
jgi:hypothetical protein